MIKQLLVDSIRIDGDTQSRVRINDETVAEYAAAMLAPPGPGPGPAHAASAGQAWPPVAVFSDGTEYWLADGFHRLLAARRAGRKHIAAEVKQGSREDAAWAACAANQTHGLRRTNADKRKAVEIALRLHPEMTDPMLAEHCGVSHPFVGDVRRHVETVSTWTPPATRIGRDGKNYSAPSPKVEGPAAQGLGPPPQPGESRRHSPPPTAPGGMRGTKPPGPGGPAAPRVPEYPVDDVGRRIPEHLAPLWERRQEVQDLLTALSRVRVALRAAQDSVDPLFSEIPFSSALAHLDQAYDAVQVAKPYAVCAFCQGQGCKVCGKRGLLGKFRWDTSVPREHKEAVARLVEQERSGRAA